MRTSTTFADLPALAVHLRQVLEEKKFVLLYAYNGTGKTRLSMDFKNIGKQGDARHAENGSAKVGHGSGVIISLRAE